MINKDLILSIYEDRYLKSKLSSQMLYGDKFRIIKKFKKSLKIKTMYDGYIGFIKKKYYPTAHILNYKVSILEANLYSKPNLNFKLKKKISFSSLINVKEKKNKFYRFDDYWIKKTDISPIKNKIKILSKIKIFKNVKYKWGGSSYKGVDCSALVQLFFKYNNRYCPRNSIDQLKYFKNVQKSKIYKKNQLIFWKGHVAICINNKELIHAYGPKKKVIIMNILNTINQIQKKSNLYVIGVKKLNAI